MNRRRYFLIALLIPPVLLGLLWQNSKSSSYPADKTERIRIIKRIISEPVPGEILDAEYLSIQIGDGCLGPSDFQLFLRLSVPPAETEQWLKGLGQPFNHSDNYAEPTPSQSWWLSKSQYEKSKLYETRSLFGRHNGWLCIDKDKGFIYVYTFTM
jgi:hypothetical protein